MLRRFLSSGAMLTLAILLVQLPALAPAATADLIRVTSMTVTEGARTPNEGATVKVLAKDGRHLPYTEANLRAQARTSVVGKVDPATGQLVGAAATEKFDCDSAASGNTTSCLTVTFYNLSGSYIVSSLYSSLATITAPPCGPMVDRWTNFWRNITIKQGTVGPPTGEECVAWGTNSRRWTWYGTYSTAHSVGAGTRYHTTWSGYDDGANGHPIVFVP